MIKVDGKARTGQAASPRAIKISPFDTYFSVIHRPNPIEFHWANYNEYSSNRQAYYYLINPIHCLKSDKVHIKSFILHYKAFKGSYYLPTASQLITSPHLATTPQCEIPP